MNALAQQYGDSSSGGLIVWLVILLVAAVIPASIASRKGRNFVGWYIYGVLLWIVALIHSLLLRPNPKLIEEKDLKRGELKKCPNCAELVKSDARVCRYCGHSFESSSSEGPAGSRST